MKNSDTKMTVQFTYLHVLFNVKSRTLSTSWHALNIYGNIIVAKLKIQENKTFLFYIFLSSLQTMWYLSVLKYNYVPNKTQNDLEYK